MGIFMLLGSVALLLTVLRFGVDGLTWLVRKYNRTV